MNEGDGAPATPPPLQRNRRQVLAAGLALAATAGLPGCSVSDPRITATRAPSPRPSSATATPTPTPESPPAARQLLGAEQSLADLAAAILTGPRRRELSRRQSALLTSLRDAHLQHCSALRSPVPTQRPVLPPSSAKPTPSDVARLSLAGSLSRLRAQEDDQSARARGLALRTEGFDALLAGALSVAAGTYASLVSTPDPAAVSVDDAPRLPMTALSDIEAWQAMVRQLHAMVYGYQLALGRLPASSPRGRSASAALRDRRALRYDLEAALLARSASVPAAAGAYVPPVQPTSADRAATLIRRMETALTPFCGLWVAAATRTADRTLALDTLAGTFSRARSWGAVATVWPGWQD